MPREIITVQVGQCGNQIGLRFWDLALKEHSLYNKNGIYDEALSSFFRNVDSRKNGQIDLEAGTRINDLKARAIIVDMESGVIDKKILGGELKDIFESR
jgi:tubulin epsilon